jgi:putative hydrolase of the HAD superfamily
VRLKAVIFDLYWTLLYEEETGLNAKAEELARSVGVEPEEWHKGWHRTLEASWRNEVSLLGRVREALRCAGAAECDGGVAETLAGLMAARSTPRLYDDVRESLGAIKEMGVGMGLISNISTYRAGWLRELELDRYFDAMTLSCNLGIAKPDERIYRAAMEGLGARPEECALVDDVPPYVQAGRKLGMVTVRINRFGSDEIYREYYDDLDFEADLRIEGLGELVEWLENAR